MHVDLNNNLLVFCHRLFLSLWSELLMAFCRGLEKKKKKKKNVSPREMVWSTAFYPDLFLTGLVIFW